MSATTNGKRKGGSHIRRNVIGESVAGTSGDENEAGVACAQSCLFICSPSIAWRWPIAGARARGRGRGDTSFD